MPYTPLQLGDRERNGVSYSEYAPSPDFATAIHCYWELSTGGALDTPFDYRILPDGCIDVIIDCNNADAWVAGATAEVSTVGLGTRFHFFGIRFLPGMFPLLIGCDAASLSRSMPALDETGVAAHIAPEAIAEAPDATGRVLCTESSLRGLLGAMRQPDSRVQFAVSALMRGRGDVAIETEMAWAVTPRHLRRLVREAVGLSPKEFARVVRFQSMLRSLRGRASAGWLPVALRAGYCDQSHWIRETKRMYGLTPGRLAALIGA